MPSPLLEPAMADIPLFTLDADGRWRLAYDGGHQSTGAEDGVL